MKREIHLGVEARDIHVDDSVETMVVSEYDGKKYQVTVNVPSGSYNMQLVFGGDVDDFSGLIQPHEVFGVKITNADLSVIYAFDEIIPLIDIRRAGGLAQLRS